MTSNSRCTLNDVSRFSSLSFSFYLFVFKFLLGSGTQGINIAKYDNFESNQTISIPGKLIWSLIYSPIKEEF